MGEPLSLPAAISQLLVQVFGDDREAVMGYAVAQGHGVEIADFISPARLDNPAECAELVSWYRERLPGVRGLVSFHGAFWNLLPGASDARILAATQNRVNQSLDLAEAVGAACVVFHLGFDWLSLDPGYAASWAQREGAFWRSVMEGRSLPLVLENTREPRPQVVEAVVQAIGVDSTGICFDAGHAYLRSLPLGPQAAHLQGATPLEWINYLGKRIGYLHLSDNDRSYDQHLPLGRGTVGWPALLAALAGAGVRAPAVMEVEGFEGARVTEEYLRSLGGEAT